MTKARTIANLGTGFVNISDTGTEGTKVASGTTAQRGSTAGQIRFNTTTGLAEYYTGSEFKSIDTPPTVTAVSPLEVERWPSHRYFYGRSQGWNNWSDS